jgi:hypothetical protein
MIFVKDDYNKFIMYNSFIYAKKNKELEINRSSIEKDVVWLKRYQSQVKPILLQRYDARINSFIRNVLFFNYLALRIN